MQRFWDASLSLCGIDTGPPDSSKRMLVFFDPDCHVCARQWQILRPYLDTIRIHWIPVAYIDRDSLKRAAAILSAEDPVRALYRNEEHYDFELKSGGYPLPSHVPDRAISAVQANTHSPAFTERAAVTPLLGLELYKGERYVRYPGMIGARYIPIIIKELGNTKHPYARTKELLRQRSGTEK